MSVPLCRSGLSWRRGPQHFPISTSPAPVRTEWNEWPQTSIDWVSCPLVHCSSCIEAQLHAVNALCRGWWYIKAARILQLRRAQLFLVIKVNVRGGGPHQKSFLTKIFNFHGDVFRQVGWKCCFVSPSTFPDQSKQHRSERWTHPRGGSHFAGTAGLSLTPLHTSSH